MNIQSEIPESSSPLSPSSPVLPSSPIGLTKEEVMTILHPVCDPEVPFSIVDLGLVYDVEFPKPEAVKVKMTLTSPVCPAGPELMKKVEEALKANPGVKETEVELVWSPMWDPRTMATEEVQIQLGLL